MFDAQGWATIIAAVAVLVTAIAGLITSIRTKREVVEVKRILNGTTPIPPTKYQPPIEEVGA
jgi:hypothetical protein